MSMTRPGYSSFSRSLSLSLFAMALTAGEVEGEMMEECGAAVGASVDIIASATACRPALGVAPLGPGDEGGLEAFGAVSASSCVRTLFSEMQG